MKKWILAAAALTILTGSAALAAEQADKTKTVITIEQENPRPVSPGTPPTMPGQNFAPPVIVNESGARVETDKETGTVSCPCPYSMDEHGQLCGEESVYSKNNGRSPDCYAKGGANPDVPVNNIYIK